MGNPIRNVAGMSLGGGRKENFFFSLLEYYPEKKRWFLKSLHQVKDEDIRDRDEIIASWVETYCLKQLVVDFPLSRPPCEDSCLSNCEGANVCPRHQVQEVRSEMKKLLDEDANFQKTNPKKYEQERVASLEVDYSKNLLKKNTDEHMLSRSFKRKLRKGFTPYWHRPIDFWVWKNYYDQLLEVFKNSYESFGNVSFMLLARLNYLLRHLPKDLTMYESNIQICLLELYRARIVSKSLLLQLFDLDMASSAREQIILNIEKHMEIFIYENDLETIIKNSNAFDSFILSVVGQRMLMNGLREIPDWGNTDGGNFIVPMFHLQG
ncbi:hypothetical protein ACJVC5_09610 [Peredibacter sp. HCB2-198]|uniref:hypothetical protein n=1 Tax=Peredibacter sp. HCB2-198 TaxID=3383025 RepID=UPI0038B58AFE